MTRTNGRWTRVLRGEGLTSKATLNGLAAGLEYGARLAVGFLLNPILVSGLGDQAFGAWQVLQRLIGYVGPAAGRSTQVLRWTIAHEQSSRDEELKRRYVGGALAVWLLLLPVMLTLGGLLTWLSPTWLKVEGELAWAVRLAAGLLVARLVSNTLTQLPRSVLEGENLGYKRMGWSAALVLLGGAITGLAVHLDLGLVGVAAATVVNTLLTGAFFARVAWRHVSWFGIAKPSKAMLRRFLGLSGWFLTWSVVMALMRSSDVVLLGMVAPLESVTTYSLTKYVPEILVEIVAIMVLGATPGLGGIIGAGDLERARRVRTEVLALTFVLLAGAGSTILLWSSSFLRLWVGDRYDAGTLPTLLILVMIAQLVFIRTEANIIDLTLDLRRKVLLGLLSTALSISLASLLLLAFDAGIVGLVSGFIAGRLVLSIGYPAWIARFLGTGLRRQLPPALRPALVLAALFATSCYLGTQIQAGGWLSFILGVGVSAPLMLALAFLLGVPRSMRKQLGQRVRRALGAGRGTA